MKKRILSGILIICLLFGACGSFAFAEQPPAYHGIGSYDLFMKYPYYLNNEFIENNINSTCNTYMSIIGKYDKGDEFISALKTASSQGIGYVLRDIGSKMGLVDSFYDQCMDAASMALLKEVYADELSVKSLKCVKDAAKSFKWIKNISDTSTATIGIVASNTKNLSAKEAEEIIGTVKKNYSKVLSPVTDAMDIAKYACTACVIADVQIEMLDLLMEKTDANGELYKGLSRIRSQMKQGIVQYTMETFIENKALGELSSKVMKYGWKNLDISSGATIIGSLVVKFAVWYLFDKIFPHPAADTVITNWILVSYVNDLQTALIKQRRVFTQPFYVSDMDDYQILFSTLLHCINATLDATKGIAETTGDTGRLENEKTGFNNILKNYDVYLDRCCQTVAQTPESERITQTYTPEQALKLSSGNYRIGEGGEDDDTIYAEELPLTSDGSTWWGIKVDGGTLRIFTNADIPDISIGSRGVVEVAPDAGLTVSKSFYHTGKLTGGTVYLKGDTTGGGGTVENLMVSGAGAQNFSGNLNAENLTYANTGTVTQTGKLYVSGTVRNDGAKVIGGENTVLKSTGSIYGNAYHSGLTLDGVTLNKALTIRGNLFTQNTVNLSDITVEGVMNQTDGTLNLNGTTSVKSDAYFGGTVNQEDHFFYAHGDISGSKISLGDLVLCGKLQQNIDSSITVGDFYNNNTTGLNVNATVTVNGTAKSVKAPKGGQNVRLSSTAGFDSSDYYGDVTVTGLAGNLPPRLYGTVYLTGNVTQNADAQLTHLTQSGGKLSLENAVLTVTGIYQNTSSSASCAMNETAVLTLRGDSANAGSITGGTLHLFGDLSNSGTVTVGKLKITANAPVELSGSKITADYLETGGISKINLLNPINILKGSDVRNRNINFENIVFSSGYNTSESVTHNTLLTVNGDFIIDGKTVTAEKGLTVKNGNIKLLHGARLIVNGVTEINGSSSCSFYVDSTSSADLNKLLIVNTMGDIKVDGTLKFGSDAVLSSTALSGDGTILLQGDLIGSSLAVNQPKNFRIIGKLPQEIQASGANFKNLDIVNTSRGGVTFTNAVNCYGTYQINDSKVTGTVTKK